MHPLNNRVCLGFFDGLCDSYVNLPIQSIINLNFPLQFHIIQQHQQKDSSLQQLQISSPSQFKLFSINNTQLLHYRRNESDQWKIFLPNSLIPITIDYYNRLLHHPGATRLYDAIANHFYFTSTRSAINRFIKLVTSVSASTDHSLASATSLLNKQKLTRGTKFKLI